MLGEIFYWLFNMSIVASVSGLFILLLRLIRIIPRRIILFLWGIPFIRMWFPVGISSKFSLLHLVSLVTTRTVTVYDYGSTHFSMTNSLMLAEDYFPITYEVKALSEAFQIASIVWAVFALAILVAVFFVYFGTKATLKDAVHLRDNLYCSGKINSPGVYGIIKPRIILPPFASEASVNSYVVLHEQTHIRRMDNLWRMLAFITTAVHWFNPFSWIFLNLFLRDLEIACDESVLTKIPPEKKKDYANCLLDVVESRNLFLTSFGGASIRTRIEYILSFKKMTFAAILAFSGLAAVIAWLLLTNAPV